MLHSTFTSISELIPGAKWQELFVKHWPAYRTWFLDKGKASDPNLHTSIEQFRRYMPELLPTYERLCALTGWDELASRFLTGYQPPAYIGGCSQVAWHRQLVRNYDYHPHLS
jgi:predicted choloylglycine hydrolase